MDLPAVARLPHEHKTREVAYAYPRAMRVVLAVLVLWRWCGVWLVSALVVLATDPPVTPPLLARLVAVSIALPWLVEYALRYPFRARVSGDGEVLGLELRFFRLEIPRELLSGATPWRVPLPGPGVHLITRRGTPLRERVEVGCPRCWAEEHRLPLVAAEDWACRGTLAFSEARAARPPVRWYHYGVKFFLFGLVPTALLFQLHQHIAYGSLWGEYYQRGWAAYLRTWCVYYGTVVTYLMLLAGVLRSAMEWLLWLAAQLAPLSAPRIRLRAEQALTMLYYGGVLILLALRFAGCG
ncbi:MAG: hypothetical protein N3C12_11385 [Candidatus Binatia bacterium]|nr:hypothetical protein [Candidatus Binatia bacterium]